ncbi:sulfatase family protein [Alteribacter populi]|uniref:sulfatase family protein n=1 Tax=Alteribacter populi TaxID=2011011 RepID=UPI000BBB6272|nr:sulfatase [Alteribacter populi]
MAKKRPNIVYIMSDDHATQAISSYGSKINETPNIDRLAKEGKRFDHVYCTNALCAPSRATVLTGNYSHVNGVRGLSDRFDGRQQTFPKLLQQDGYQTALVGKWHLGHGGHSDPTGFDYWNVFPRQGAYYNPVMMQENKEKKVEGYASDVITEDAIQWLDNRDKSQPFLLMLHHKAPHRPWDPPERYKDLYEDSTFPEPETFNQSDDKRSKAAQIADMRIEDMNERDVKGVPPEGLTKEEIKSWKYQRYIKDYLRCVTAMDDNIGSLLDYLDEHNLTEDTIVVYTSDQGFFLGEHGWYDKRFMYEESLRMPFLIRYPKEIEPGTTSKEMIINNDFAPTLLHFTGVNPNEEMQGESFKSICTGSVPENWRKSVYYRYWEHLKEHYVCAHFGIRTERYKLIYYYGDPLDVKGALQQKTEPEWELFDLQKDPLEINNVYKDPNYHETLQELKQELNRLREYYKETQ